MSNLFDIAADYREAADRLSELDLPPEVVTDTLESLSGDLTVKATNIAAMTRNWRALAAAIKDAEQRMAERRKALEARASRVEDYLLNAMLYARMERVDSPMLAVAVKVNPPAVVIDNAEQVPAGYLRQPEPPPPEPDKVRIKSALAAGQDVPGCRLVQRKRIDIR